jgi:hypothetical protein
VKGKKKSVPGQAGSHRCCPAVHPTRFRVLASPFPAVVRFVTRPEGAACHPRAPLPSPFRVPLRRHKARPLRPANRMRRVAQAILRLLPRRPLVFPPLWLSLPLRPCRALRIYAACPCPHAIQLPEVVANAPRQLQVLSPLHQWAVSRPRGHDEHSRGTVGASSEHWLGSVTGVRPQGRPCIPLGSRDSLC